MRPLPIAAALACLFAFPAAASAAVVVAPGASIDRAVANAAPGGTVLVRGGSHPRLDIPAGARLRGVTIRPYRSARPSIRGVRIGHRGGGVRIVGFRITDITELDDARGVTLAENDFSPHGIVGSGRRLRFLRNHLHDLTIRRDPGARGFRCNRFSSGAGVAPRCGYAFRLWRSSGVVIAGNRMTRIPVDGLQLLEMRNTRIEENLFEDISAFVDRAEHSDAIQMLGDSDRVSIRRNFFHRTRGVLAQQFKGRGAQRRLVIENNVMVRLRHWGLNLFDAPGARVVNNTIWDTGGRGIALSDYAGDPTPMTGAVVANNVVSILRAPPSTMAFEDHNMIGQGTLTGSHDLAVPRPPFLAPASGDYSFGAGSPAVDAGLARLAPRTDVRGAPRRGAADIGAYELAGSGNRD